MTAVMRVVGRADGRVSSEDGKYLKAGDPVTATTHDDFEWTTDLTEAMHFPNAGAAMMLWRAQSGVHPVRHTDGKPNRPLTAWTVSIETVHHKHAWCPRCGGLDPHACAFCKGRGYVGNAETWTSGPVVPCDRHCPCKGAEA